MKNNLQPVFKCDKQMLIFNSINLILVKMPGANYIVLNHMRPPVAIDSEGISPLRTRRAR